MGRQSIETDRGNNFVACENRFPGAENEVSQYDRTARIRSR